MSTALMRQDSDPIIQRTDRARILLAEAKSATDAKQVVDLARAAEVYGRRQKLAEEAIANATAIKVDAMTMMGEFLKTTKKATGGDAQRTRFQKGTESPPTLTETGISKKESSNAQLLVTIKTENPELFEKARSGKITVEKARTEHKKATEPPKPRAKPKPPEPKTEAPEPEGDSEPVPTFSKRPSSRAKLQFRTLFNDLRREWIADSDKEEMSRFFQSLAIKAKE